MAYRTQGVPPKPASKRRRRNVRASYGAAEPVTAPAASPGPRTLGIADAHPLIVDMWHAVQGSSRAGSSLRLIGSGCAGSCGTPTMQ